MKGLTFHDKHTGRSDYHLKIEILHSGNIIPQYHEIHIRPLAAFALNASGCRRRLAGGEETGDLF